MDNPQCSKVPILLMFFGGLRHIVAILFSSVSIQPPAFHLHLHSSVFLQERIRRSEAYPFPVGNLAEHFEGMQFHHSAL